MTQTWQTQASVDWNELDRSIFPLWKKQEHYIVALQASLVIKKKRGGYKDKVL